VGNHFRLFILALALCAATTGAATSQAQTGDLPRHAVIGVQISAADLSKPEDPATNPPTIKAVLAGGAGQVAGLEAGDVLVALDNQRIASAGDFAQRIARHPGGDSVSIRVLRNGAPVTKTVVLKPRPLETSSDADILYTAVSVEGSRRRVIVTHPKTPGAHPAVLLIGGLGCYSLDGAVHDPGGYGPILTALMKKEFATMRVEKTGQGDSEAPDCTDVKATAELEMKGYVAGLRLLKSYDFVDPKQVFIFAHSLGPLLGSLVIQQESVRGFVAAETIGRSWFEYGLENVRRQAALVGEPLDQVDADVRAHAECAYHLFIAHETAEHVRKLGTPCGEMIDSYAGMPYTYMQQIGDLSLAKQWMQIDMPVLVIYGTSDPATSADEGRYLAGLINSFHPGRATYVELLGMGHDFARYDSQLDFLNRRKDPAKPHPYDTEVVDVLLKWLFDHLQG
jgi:pimeloyl-ACP methyl ester carboxylesterase